MIKAVFPLTSWLHAVIQDKGCSVTWLCHVLGLHPSVSGIPGRRWKTEVAHTTPTTSYWPEITLMTPATRKVWKCNLVMCQEKDKVKFDESSLAPATLSSKKAQSLAALVIERVVLLKYICTFNQNRLAISFLGLNCQHIPELLVCHLLYSLDVNRSW